MMRARRQECVRCCRMKLRDEAIFPKVGDQWRTNCLYKVVRPYSMSLLMRRKHTETCDDLTKSFLEYSSEKVPAAAPAIDPVAAPSIDPVAAPSIVPAADPAIGPAVKSVRSTMFSLDRSKDSFARKLFLLLHGLAFVTLHCSHDSSFTSSLSSMKSMRSLKQNLSRPGCVRLSELIELIPTSTGRLSAIDALTRSHSL